jgi:hypothetical protein
MQKAVTWWCDLIGVTDPLAIQIAIGVEATSLLLAIMAIWGIVASLVNATRRPWSIACRRH